MIMIRIIIIIIIIMIVTLTIIIVVIIMIIITTMIIDILTAAKRKPRPLYPRARGRAGAAQPANASTGLVVDLEVLEYLLGVQVLEPLAPATPHPVIPCGQ